MYPSEVTTVEFLRNQFPPTLSVRQVSKITSEHEQTIRNKLSKETYPIPSFKIGRKRLFRLVDVAAFIDQQCLEDHSHPSKKRRARGRPTKVQQRANVQSQSTRATGGNQ